MAPFFCRLWMFKRSTSSLKKPERETQQDSVMRRSSFIRDLKHYQREETERAAMFPSSSFLVTMKMKNGVEISAVFTLTWQKTDSNAKNSSKVIHQPLSVLVDVKHFVFQHVTNDNNSSTRVIYMLTSSFLPSECLSECQRALRTDTIDTIDFWMFAIEKWQLFSFLLFSWSLLGLDLYGSSGQTQIINNNRWVQCWTLKSHE